MTAERVETELARLVRAWQDALAERECRHKDEISALELSLAETREQLEDDRHRLNDLHDRLSRHTVETYALATRAERMQRLLEELEVVIGPVVLPGVGRIRDRLDGILGYGMNAGEGR